MIKSLKIILISAILFSNIKLSYNNIDSITGIKQERIEYSRITNISTDMTYSKIVNILGLPNGIMGSGMICPFYIMEDESILAIHCSINDFGFDEVLWITLIKENGEVITTFDTTEEIVSKKETSPRIIENLYDDAKIYNYSLNINTDNFFKLNSVKYSCYEYIYYNHFAYSGSIIINKNQSSDSYISFYANTPGKLSIISKTDSKNQTLMLNDKVYSINNYISNINIEKEGEYVITNDSSELEVYAIIFNSY